MEITINKSEGVSVSVVRREQSFEIGSKREIDFNINPQTLSIQPQKSSGPAFEFVHKVLAGANVVRCTLAEFEAIGSYDGHTWYAVTTTTDELRYLYLGATLIAQADQSGGTWGFAYTFPIIFGR